MSTPGFAEWLAEKDPELLQREFDLMGLLFDKQARKGYGDAVKDRWNYGNWPILRSVPAGLAAGIAGTLGAGPLVGVPLAFATMWAGARRQQEKQWEKDHPSRPNTVIDDVLGKDMRQAAMNKCMKSK